MSRDSESFLSRWSKRKLEDRQARELEPQADESAPAEEQPASDPEPELTPEEIAALPKIEDLTADSDISAFLRKGVPEVLKKAALRRMWLLDPAIRDFVGDARDYAYDWNVSGGVPGNGPLLPTDDVQAMVRQVLGRPSESEDSERSPPDRMTLSQGGERQAISDDASLPEQRISGAHVPTEAPLTPHRDQPEQEASGGQNGGGGDDEAAAAFSRRSAENPPLPRRRRHGRAKPV